MSDLITQSENENQALNSANSTIENAKADSNTNEAVVKEKTTDFDDFATSIFEKISKPKFAGNFDKKEKLWEKYKEAYEADYGENAQEVFNSAYKASADYHRDLALQEVEDNQLAQVIDDASWIMPFGDDVKKVDPSMSTTTMLETNSGKLQMIDWWTGATRSVREASINAKSYINGDGIEVDVDDVNSLDKLLDTVDSTGKEIIGFQYDGASEYGRGDATLRAVYRGEQATGELATVWDLKDSWLSNNGLTSNIAKTTVGSVMNFGMDVLDTAFTLAGATAGLINSDSDFYKDMMEYSMRMQQYSMNKSDYDMSKMFTVNNMLDMAINTGLQLLLAGGVSGAANTLARMVATGAKSAAVKAGKMTATQAAKALAKQAAKGYGRKAGLYVLGGMASKDAYQEALKAGFTEREAAAIYFASYAAMFQANKLSNFTDDAFGMIGSKRFGNSVAKSVFKNVTPDDVVDGKGIMRIANTIGKGTAKQIEKLYSKPGLVGAAFSEAMEEEVELVAQEAVNHMANMYSAIGYKDDLKPPKFKSVMDEGYWEEKGWEALLSGIGGAMGGMMAGGARRLRRKNTTDKNISDDQWPVQGNEADALKRLAFERARGTKKGKVASEKFMDTLSREKDKGRFGREDYSTVWDSEEGRYKRMTELSPEEATSKMSQADVLYNSIVAQFDHYTALYGNYTGTYEEITANNPEIQGVYGEEALFNEVSDLLSKKQDILSKSKAGSAPGVDAQLNTILSREDAILDTVIKNTEMEVERFKASREKESIEADETSKEKDEKAETVKDGQPEETIEIKEELKQSVNSATEKLLLDEINRLAGALGVGGSDMKSLLETQRRLKDIEEGKFVERGIVNTLTNSSHFRNTLGANAPKKYRQYGSVVENLFKGDLNLKKRVNSRKADGLRFTENFQDKLKGIPSDIEGLADFIDSSDLPFLSLEQKSKLISKILKSVPALEEIKRIKVVEFTQKISDLSVQLIGEPIAVIADEGDTSQIVAKKLDTGVKALVDKVLAKHLDEDLVDIPEHTRKLVAKVLHTSTALNSIVNAQTSEDISRVTYDPEEIDLVVVDESGWEVSVNDFLDTINYGDSRGILDNETASKKVEIPEEVKEAERLIAKVEKAEDPLGLKNFEGDYFTKNFAASNIGIETLDQSLEEALQFLEDSAPKDEKGKMIAFTDTDGVNDLKEKIAIRKAQAQLVQRAFKIIADVRGYNKYQFVGGFDKSVNNNTFFSSYVQEMIGDPLRYFELANKKSEETITDEESKEFTAMYSVIGSPDSNIPSEIDMLVDHLTELENKADNLLSLASNSSDGLKQNYYVSTIKYLDELADSALSAISIEKFEGNEDAQELYNIITSASAAPKVSATEEGAIEALKSVVTIKNALYALGQIQLESGRTGKDAVGYSEKYDVALTSIYYNPSKFNSQLKEVLEMVGAGKEPADMKLPTVDQLIVAEQLAANSTTNLNKFVRKNSFTTAANLNVNVTTMVGLQGTGKTEVVAGMSASIIQKELARQFGDRATDHKALMCGNTEKQCVKLHEAAVRNGVTVGAVDGNKSMNQFDLYNLLVNKNKNESEEEHIERIKSKLDGIDILIYDEASYIEFLDSYPESANDFKDVGTLNAMLYQISKVNNLRGNSDPKLSVILMGDETQGGFMEGMKSPRNPEAEFTITGKGTQGAIGSGRLPRTRKLTRTFRFEVPSLKKDIDTFRETTKVETKGMTAVTSKRSMQSSWNVISNDITGKLGGVKFSNTWSELCDDTETVDNIRKQLESDPDFDAIIITNGGIDSIVEGSKLRDLVNEYDGTKRIEVASMYSAQGSEASYSLVNVPNNMLVSVDDKGIPDKGEVNIISMAMGRAKYFTQVAVSGNAIDLASTNESEITKQSEPEVALFRESWYKVLNEGLFSGDLSMPDSEINEQTVEEEDITTPTTQAEVVVDLNDPNVSSPAETENKEKELKSELGVTDGKQSTLDSKKQDLNSQLKDNTLSDNKRNEIESTLNLVKNLTDKQSEESVIKSLDNEGTGNRNEDEKLKIAEELGYIVSYSSRNLAAGPTPSRIGLKYQVQDTERIFGTSMSPELVDMHKADAIGHNGKENMQNYEYKLITYQFMFGKKVATNTGLFAQPKNSHGDWFMCASFPISSIYDSEFGTWLREQEATLFDAREKHLKDDTDILAVEYADLIQLGNKAQIIAQKGDKNKLFALSRNIMDGGIEHFIHGTTAGSLETDPIKLQDLATEDTNVLNVAARILGSTGSNVLELPNGTSLKNRVTDTRIVSRLSEKLKNKKSTADVLKMDIFAETDGNKVIEISIDDNEYKVVMVKTARGTIPYIQQAGLWSPFFGIYDNKILSNPDVSVEDSNFYDAELANISTNLDQLLTDSKVLEEASTGIGTDRINSITAANLRYNPGLLNSDRGSSDVIKAITNQFYKNVPQTLDKLQVPLRDAISLIKSISAHVTFSKPMVVRTGKKAGHSVVFYSTRNSFSLEDKSSEELQNLYKTIASNRNPDSESVEELLGLNREGVGVIWLNQKGYNFSQLDNIVENTDTTLSKKLFQLSTWGNANDNLVAMFAAIAEVTNTHDESNRLPELLEYFEDRIPLAEVESWVESMKAKNPEAFNAFTGLLSYMFTPAALGKVSTHFTTNPHLDTLLGIQDEGRAKDWEPSYILEQLKEYVDANEEAGIQAVLDDYNITLKDIAHLDIASKSDLAKGELVRNKKTGKPVVNYDVIRFIPPSVIQALTGQDENITPEINLVNLFQRLNESKYSDHKADILNMLDDLLPNIPGMSDNIYASPFISLNNDSTLEVGISPDNGDLMEDLTTSVKMIAQPGVVLNIPSMLDGFVFDNVKANKTDNTVDSFEDTKLKITEDSKNLVDDLDASGSPDFDSVIKKLNNLKKTHNFSGDEKLSINSIIQNAISNVSTRFDEYKASLKEEQTTDPTKTNLMEKLGVSEDNDAEIDLYTELHSLDFVREHFIFDNNAAQAYVNALNNIDMSSLVSNPARAMDLTMKQEKLVEEMSKFIAESPVATMSDTSVNIKLASLDFDNPVRISTEFLNQLDPNDNSLNDWNDHKTSRPSIPHLYAILTNGDIHESVKINIAGILRYGVGKKGKKLRIELINMLHSGQFEIVEYNRILEELAATESQESADQFATSRAVLQAFEVFKASRNSDDNTKLAILNEVYNNILSVKESERTEGLTQLQSALHLLLKNDVNLTEDKISLIESVENSLNSSIISESHLKGELTQSQLMMNIFENTVTYSKKGLSEEASRIFEEMRVNPDEVPGLIQIHNHTQNPTEAGQPAYLEALDDFKSYLRAKTTNRSVLREFNKLISESFCK